MTVGLPGAGIGGLFYLASTILLPLRSLLRRWRGHADTVAWRHHAHHLMMATGIVGGLWLTGWLLAFIVPHEMLMPAASLRAGSAPATTVLSLATLSVAVGTLVTILVAVEVARFAHVRRPVADQLGADGD